MNSLAATSHQADLARRNGKNFGVPPSVAISGKYRYFGKFSLATLSFALAIILPTVGLADSQSLNYSGEAPSEQMQLGMLPGANANIVDLDFRYRLTGEASLKPVRVYNNSITTTIEFAKPPGDKAPTLLIDGNGKYLNESVKYSKNPDRLIVDGLFDSAVLIYSGTRKGSVAIERLVKAGASPKGAVHQPSELAVTPTALQPVAPLAVTSQVKSFPTAPQPVTSVDVIRATPLPPLQTAQSVVVPAVAAPLETWNVSPSDVTLRRALAKWVERAGWQLVWEASVDVPLNVSATFEGDFRTVVKRLFSSLSAAEVNLTGLMYSGNQVLRVTESGRRAE